MLVSRILGITLLILSLANFIFAGSTGKIAGLVTDKTSGEPLIGVNIVVEGTTFGSSTDIDGTFIILNIPPGNYTLIAQYIGYSNVRMENVDVDIDLTTEVQFTMQETSLELGETVTVVAERELVTKDLTASTAKVDAQQIQALPITEISEALELQAGYLDGHVRGGRKGEIAYWIDGIPVTDSYDGGQVVEINKDMVEELQFVSGAFNAEYGQAMSGIVNITTKEPREKFGANFTVYFGDYYSSHNFDRTQYYKDLEAGTRSSLLSGDEIYQNVNNFDPTNIRNFEGSIFGTIVPNKLSYFINARHIYFGGWQYGQRIYNPENISYVDSAGNFIEFRDSDGRGDGEYVPMNWNRKIYLQGKLTYYFSPLAKINYNFIRDDVDFEEYNRDYKLNPDGNLNRNRRGYTHLLKLTHTLSNSTYYDLGLSYFDKSYQQSVYDDYNDPRYVHPLINDNVQVYSFKTGGTNNQFFIRNTKTILTKLDLASQINKRHLVKTGLEFRWNSMFFDDITLRPAAGDELDLANDSPYMQPLIYEVGSIYHDQYQHNPIELSAYIQDKMEFNDIIVNIGVRVDHFRPDGVILADPSDPDIYLPLNPENRYHDLNGNGIQDADEPLVTFAERQQYWYKDASNKTQVSPRLGASFPITATGIIHFSYGHFFQIPNFELLYRNPQFKMDTQSGSTNLGIIGNADLKPQQTISGEIGLQQQIGENLVLDGTMFFRDIRDLAGTRADEIELISGETYSRLVNSDFGFIKGFIISLKNRYSLGLNYSVDYTFQIAKGTASDPDQSRNAVAGGALPEVQLTPLGWDQRHTLNGTMGYNRASWGISFIGQMGSGQPYTPRQGADVATIRENSQTKPTYWNVDMRLFKDINIFSKRWSLFLRVFNLFDTMNEVNVYDDTGRAGFTTDLERNRASNPQQYVNTIDEWYLDITHYSEPRRIEFGLMFDF
jgi:outer membrane receptor for ferrienterochelin and colicin